MDWRDRWEWLSAALAGLSAWLLRRWIRSGEHDAMRRLGGLMNAKAQLEICEAEREYLRRALQEILEAAEEHEQWRKQHQPPSS